MWLSCALSKQKFRLCLSEQQKGRCNAYLLMLAQHSILERSLTINIGGIDVCPMSKQYAYHLPTHRLLVVFLAAPGAVATVRRQGKQVCSCTATCLLRASVCCPMQWRTLLVISLVNLHPCLEQLLYRSYITHTSPDMQTPLRLQTSLTL